MHDVARVANVSIRPSRVAPAWRQTTFGSRSLRGWPSVKLSTSKLALDTYLSATHSEVPLIDAVATLDVETNRTAIFLVNRRWTRPRRCSSQEPPHQSGAGRVAPNPTARIADGQLTIELPAVS
jgi:alpha-N-arabinofuranosidase